MYRSLVDVLCTTGSELIIYQQLTQEWSKILSKLILSTTIFYGFVYLRRAYYFCKTVYVQLGMRVDSIIKRTIKENMKDYPSLSRQDVCWKSYHCTTTILHFVVGWPQLIPLFQGFRLAALTYNLASVTSKRKV